MRRLRHGARADSWRGRPRRWHAPGAVILAGERLAEVPGALAAVARLAGGVRAHGWPGCPRRAGERGAIEAGALPGLLPIGRPVTDPAARAEVARAWGEGSLPGTPGRDTTAILAAAADGELGALVVAGVDPADLPDPVAALQAIEMAPFVVSLELRASAVTDRADVVFPVAAVAEKAGTFVNWEGRGGSFERRAAGPRGASPTCRCSARSPTRWTCTSACRTRRPPARSSPPSAPGAAPARNPPKWGQGGLGGRARPPRSRGVRGDRPPGQYSLRPGASCWTAAGCKTASRSWPARPGRPWPGCPR